MGIYMQSQQGKDYKTKIFIYLLNLFPFLLLFFFLYSHKTRVHGDSSIYFTFIRDFFPVPFTFGYQVKQGATSPLWVILNAIPYRFLKFEQWLAFATILNKILIFLAVILNVLLCVNDIDKSEQRAKTIIVYLVVLLYLSTYSLFISSTQLYETSLTIFIIALSLFLLKVNRIKMGIFFSGLSILTRPELVLFFLVVIYIVSDNWKSFSKNFLSGISSPAIVYGYLFIMTGHLIPTSLQGRFIRSLENKDTSYWEKLLVTINDLLKNAPDLLIAMCLFLILLIPFCFFLKTRDKTDKILFWNSILFIFLYLMFPPMSYAQRYLLIMVPLLFPWLAIRLSLYLKNLIPVAILLITTLFFPVISHFQWVCPDNYRFSFDRILGEDFSKVIQSLDIKEQERILIYEIQFQFSTRAHLISSDGIVGGEIFPYLLNKENFERFIEQHNVKYIVTSNSYKYRDIYKNTLLYQLFEFDLNHPVNSKYETQNLVFSKITENPVRQNPELFRIKEGMLVYAPTDTLWKHHSLLWNAIYKVERKK